MCVCLFVVVYRKNKCVYTAIVTKQTLTFICSLSERFLMLHHSSMDQEAVRSCHQLNLCQELKWAVGIIWVGH